MEELAERAGTGGLHEFLQLSGGLLDRAGFVVRLFGFPIGEKAASLVDME